MGVRIKSFTQKYSSAAASEFVLPLLVLALATFVYSLYGFDGPLLRDYSIYLYSGQRVAEGVPPYVGIFDHKGPLSPILAGVGVMLSKLFASDDVLTVRLLFFFSGCLTVVAVYLLGNSVFRSRAVGLFGALTFLGFYPYAHPAGSGPEPKTPMVLFEVLSLLVMSKKRWFWAGLFGSLAFLVWQPMAAFALVVFVLAITRPKEERYRAVLRALGGIATPLVATVGYFYYYGALRDLLEGVILFNARYLTRGTFTTTPLILRSFSQPLSSWWETPVSNIVIPYSTMLVPIVIGLTMILRLYFRRPFEYRFAPILLSFPLPPLWALLDFQLSDDFFVYLPYVAVGFGAFVALVSYRLKMPRLVGLLAGALLLAMAFANTLDIVSAPAANRVLGTDVTLSQQREGALEIENEFGEDANLASINSPQVLVLLHRKNANPYLFITAGIDKEIDAKWPGGFEGWLQGLEGSDVISFFGEGQSLLPGAESTPEHREELIDWLDARYHMEEIGPWYLLVKNSPSDAKQASVKDFFGSG